MDAPLTCPPMLSVRKLPLFDANPLLSRAQEAISRNLGDMHRAGRYILGDQLRLFETELAAAFGAKCGVGVGSGSAAIEICLREAGIVSREQEVIVPAFTSLFTAQAVLAAGASLRFGDVDPHTLLLSAESAEAAWTPRVAAVICVHLYGNVCEVGELAALCASRKAVLIQDACQAHGATVHGKPFTAFSQHTAYSFYPTKNLGCLGDGGMVLTDSPRVARRLRLLRDGGRAGDQLARAPGINSRLDELHSCYLRAFLPHVPYWTAHRRRLAGIYEQRLKESHHVQAVCSDGDRVHHQYVIRTPRRAELRSALLGEGIETAVHYPVALHRHPAFRARATWRALPAEAQRAAEEVLSLPLGPHVTESDAHTVADLILDFISAPWRT